MSLHDLMGLKILNNIKIQNNSKFKIVTIEKIWDNIRKHMFRPYSESIGHVISCFSHPCFLIQYEMRGKSLKHRVDSCEAR